MGVSIDGVPLEEFGKLHDNYWNKIKDAASESTFDGNVFLGFELVHASNNNVMTLYYLGEDNSVQSSEFGVGSVKDVFEVMREKELFICPDSSTFGMIHDTEHNVTMNYYGSFSYNTKHGFYDMDSMFAGHRTVDDVSVLYNNYMEEFRLNRADMFHRLDSSDVDEFINDKYDNINCSFDDVDHCGVSFIYNERNWNTDFSVIVHDGDNKRYFEFDANYVDDDLVLDWYDDMYFSDKELDLPVFVNNANISPFIVADKGKDLLGFLHEYKDFVPGLQGFTCDSFCSLVDKSLERSGKLIDGKDVSDSVPVELDLSEVGKKRSGDKSKDKGR